MEKILNTNRLCRIRPVRHDNELKSLETHILGQSLGPTESYPYSFTKETLFKRFEPHFYDAQENIIASFYHEGFNYKIQKNAVKALALTFYYDQSLDENYSLDEWKKSISTWAYSTFGNDKMISMVYHDHDCSLPHIHIITVPIYNNRLSAKHYCNHDYPTPVLKRSIEILFQLIYNRK